MTKKLLVLRKLANDEPDFIEYVDDNTPLMMAQIQETCGARWTVAEPTGMLVFVSDKNGLKSNTAYLPSNTQEDRNYTEKVLGGITIALHQLIWRTPIKVDNKSYKVDLTKLSDTTRDLLTQVASELKQAMV